MLRKIPTTIKVVLVSLPLLASLGCSDADEPFQELDPGTRDGMCSDATRVGGFEISLATTYTSVQGKVETAITPNRVASSIQNSGSCDLMTFPILFCEEACTSGTTCGLEGECIPAAEGTSIGSVAIAGLTHAVEMEASAPVYFYSHIGELGHPAFAEGDALVLQASGNEMITAFALGASGITALEVTTTQPQLVTGQTISLDWAPPATPDDSRMELILNITQHGGTPGYVYCDAPDTGSFSIPVELTDALLARGASGFPAMEMRRHSSDSHQSELGCVDLSNDSSVRLDVLVDGLTSCSDDDDCPVEGELCQSDLTCG